MKTKPGPGLMGTGLRTLYRLLSGADIEQQRRIGQVLLAMTESDDRPEVQEVAAHLRQALRGIADIVLDSGIDDEDLPARQPARVIKESDDDA